MLDEARRGLDRQETDLDGLRTRTTAVVSVAAVVFSLLGEHRIDRLDPWGWGALISFIVSIALAVYVLWPRRMAFGVKVAQWMERIDREKGDPQVAAWMVAKALGGMQVRNKEPIRNRVKAYAGICGLLAVQVTLWVLSGRS